MTSPTDGAIYSDTVTPPTGPPTPWQTIAYRQAAELARYRRLLSDVEHRCGWGYWATEGVPFGTVSDNEELSL